MASKNFVVCIEIRRVKKDGTVDEAAPKICFKRDGQRFGEEFTLKLPIESQLEFQVQIRPPMPVRSVSIRTEQTTIDETGVKLVDQSTPDQGSLYSFQWDTNQFEANKKRKRSMLQIIIQFQDNSKLELPLQIKFYPLDNADHLAWGTILNHVNYECQTDTNTWSILKTCYL